MQTGDEPPPKRALLSRSRLRPGRAARRLRGGGFRDADADGDHRPAALHVPRSLRQRRGADPVARMTERARRARRRHERRQGARALADGRGRSRAPSESTRSRRRSPAGPSRIPEDWWRATEAALDELGVEPASIGLSGQMHGLVVARRATSACCGPAILWNDQRTAAECAEIEERIGLERLIELTGNRALTGFTAPKLLWLRTHEPEAYARIRHVLLPKDYVRLRLTGERAIDVADASGTLLFDVAQPALERRGARRRSSCRAEWLPPVARVDGDRAPPATRPPARSASASTGPGPLSVVLGTSGVVFAALRDVPAGARGAAAHLLPRRPGDLARDGRDALGGRLAAVARAARSAARRTTSCSREAAALGAGHRGPPLPAVPRRASARRTPIRTPAAPSSASRSATTAARSSRAVLEGVAYGLRDSLELLRALGVEAERRPRLGRRRAQRAVAADRRLGARAAARADGRRGGRRVRRRAARRASRRASSPTRTRRSPPASASATGSSPTPTGRRPTRTATRATASSTRRSSDSAGEASRRRSPAGLRLPPSQDLAAG